MPETNAPLPVLLVEDDANLREALVDTLKLSGYTTLEAADGSAALKLLENTQVGIIVSDIQMQPMDGFNLLLEVKKRYPFVPMLLMTAYGDIERAVEAMRHGAAHYLTKPFEPERLLAEIARFMLPSTREAQGNVIAEDPKTLEVLALARRVASSDASVMLNGESGTGKEVIARFIHRLSPRKDKPFIAINCAAIPENLLESTLFGFEKGSFTGAATSQAGKFEQAQDGTLLLDEITEMPIALQSKLLRVLQERELERVGSHKTISLNIRVLATSNRQLQEEVKAGRFREDLYYRLNVFPLQLPALRERPRDILPLARHFLAKYAGRDGKPLPVLAADAANALVQHSWPGNIRELENVVQRALILCPGTSIAAEHLLLPAPQYVSTAAEPEHPDDIKAHEQEHILSTLAACQGVRKLAAERLRMSERTLRHKLQQYREAGLISEDV